MKILTTTVETKVFVLELTEQEILNLNVLVSTGVGSLSEQSNSGEKSILEVIEAGHYISKAISAEVFK